MTFSEKISYLRKSKGMPQNKLARALNVSRQTIYKWESGACMPELDKIKKMAEIFDVTYDVLLNDNVPLSNENDASKVTKNKVAILILVASVMLIIGIVILLIYNPFENGKISDTDNKIQHTMEHETEIRYITKNPTCYEKGTAIIGCLNCDYTETTEIGATNHKIVSSVCIYCGYIKGSSGIEYEIDENGTAYVKSIGTYSYEAVFISATYEGQIVTKVANNAFANTSITSVTFPKTITEIGSNAFENCTQLKAINFNEGLKIIGNNAFASCGAIDNLVIPDTTEKIGNSAFEGTIIEKLTIGKSVIEIGEMAFYGSSLRQGITFKDPNNWLLYNIKYKTYSRIDLTKEYYLAGMISSSISKGHIWYKK